MADDQLLTPDNTLLSRLNIEPLDGPRAADAETLGPTRMLASASAGTCTKALQADVEAFIQAGIAPATKCVCCADLDHFKGTVAMLRRTDRLSTVGPGRDGSSECGPGTDPGATALSVARRADPWSARASRLPWDRAQSSVGARGMSQKGGLRARVGTAVDDCSA